ncbi:hypothetical protein Cme02nite_50180 [Catellatospora methionotrophica]|uniref:SH3b domain-containing protein n=1 Tax=Catellatospora methionotrophica TaxID=121620 RepID=A0A8J3LK59_9ACTN|nr:M23 family metallopeptidase [Catellatospora methionotrophica]GIG16686.1 hypothetical protein Cme02nite_50180 [Catellatospora methionotrophica]
MRRLLPRALVTVLVAAAIVVPSAPALAAPVFKVPFPCGQVWGGQTRTDHSPVNAVDFNRADDVDDLVYASAPGMVDLVGDQGASGYGKYLRINHGGGYTTYYAHLNNWYVAVGAQVGYGSPVGIVGSTGNSTGPHLHYEQRLNGSSVRVKFDGVEALYYGSRNYTSSNACDGAGTGAGYIDTANSGAQNLYSAPGTSYPVAGSRNDGTYVTIYCQKAGQSVTGKWGTGNVWNRIGTNQFVPDVNTDTGYTGFIPSVARCP